ncbi:sporulation-specific protein 22 [Rhodosporidiobolus nylandii]
MSSSPHKRYSAAASPSASFVEALARVRTAISFLSSRLESSSTTTVSAGEFLAEIKTLNSRITALDASAVGASAVEKSRAGRWQDELDAAGTLLWNKSTWLKHQRVEDAEGKSESWLTTVAELRRTAYRLIRLGALEPLTADSHLSLLSLANKTSLAFFAVELFRPADELVKEAAQHAEKLQVEPASEPALAKERAKVLLIHYCCRIRTSMASGLPGVAAWVREKADELLRTEALPWREVEKLAQTAYEVGADLLQASESVLAGEAVEREKGDVAVEWLQFALQLLEAGSGETVQAMQVATLKALAQAYLDSEHRNQAEETLKQDVDPSSELRRRQIKFILARKGGDGEITQAFVDAAEHLGEKEEDVPRLLGLLHKISDERQVRPLCFAILHAMLCKLDVLPHSTARNNLAAQVFSSAIFFLGEHDRARFEGLLDAAVQAAPALLLPSSAAFLCITYLWRQGDKAHAERRFSLAAEWYLLAAHQIFGSIDSAVYAKPSRKAALCFIEAEENDRAEQILQLPAAGADCAKTHFVRFYNFSLQQNPEKAAAAFLAMAATPDFTPSLLLWAAKTANEANSKDLLALVLRTLVDVCQTGAGVSGVDLMVVLRCLIRLHLVRINGTDEQQTEELAASLISHLQAALALAASLAKVDPVPESLSKDLVWLYKTAFSVCVRFSGIWSTLSLVSLYEVTATLIRLEHTLATSSTDPMLLGKLWVCKFAALSGKVEAARVSSGAEQAALYKALAVDADIFIRGLCAALEQNYQVEKANDLLDAAFAVKVEAQAAVSDWSGLVKLVEDFEDSTRVLPVSLLKLVTDKAVGSSTCPREELCSILRKTLVLLYARQDLEVSSMALWLRMIISALIEREPDQALDYVKNAAQLIEDRPSDYPAEEVDWLLSTTWDYGVEAYGAHALDAGEKWCDMAIQLAASSGNEGMRARLDKWHASLKACHAAEDDDRIV